MTDRLAYVGIVYAILLTASTGYSTHSNGTDFNDDDTAAIKQRDLFRIERALEAAAAFLHELRLGEPS
jgi:hypothetical protein